MNILLVTPFYSPDLGPSAPLFTLLCTALVKRGHKVRVIAAVPHYPSGKVRGQFHGKWFFNSEENGVEIIRVAVPSVDRNKLFNRLIQLIVFQIRAAFATLGGNFNVALVSNPALETWLPFFCIKIFRKKPIVFSIHDVYPDVGIRLGIFHTKFVIGLITALERSCLTNATHVRILSESFRPAMIRLGVPDSKISLIYDWVDTDLIRPLSKNNGFSKEYNLFNKFVVLYAGNIGLSQGLEHILTVAKSVPANKDMIFVFVGDGAGLKKLKAQTHRMQLSNVLFVPFQPRERLPEVLASADVSLVLLRKGIGIDSLPSKTFSFLASARPIIASVDEQSQTWQLIQRSKAGICISPENSQKLVAAILRIKNKKGFGEQLGSNGRKYAEKYHSVASAANYFERLFVYASSSKKNSK